MSIAVALLSTAGFDLPLLLNDPNNIDNINNINNLINFLLTARPAPPHVRPSHGLMDVRVPPRAPELIGSWPLCARTGAPDRGNTTTDNGGVLDNEVFEHRAVDAPSPPTDRSGEKRALARLPPARAGGNLEVLLGGAAAPALTGAQDVWGFSLTVGPLFPLELGGREHPWLADRFRKFTALVWGGEQGRAHAVNAELVR